LAHGEDEKRINANLKTQLQALLDQINSCYELADELTENCPQLKRVKLTLSSCSDLLSDVVHEMNENAEEDEEEFEELEF
jgi:L-lysine 2,3-aminomutase